MTPLERMKATAAQENARMNANGRNRIALASMPRPRQKPVAERIAPFIGTGLSKADLARHVRCSPAAITKALYRMGVTIDGRKTK